MCSLASFFFIDFFPFLSILFLFYFSIDVLKRNLFSICFLLLLIFRVLLALINGWACACVSMMFCYTFMLLIYGYNIRKREEKNSRSNKLQKKNKKQQDEHTQKWEFNYQKLSLSKEGKQMWGVEAEAKINYLFHLILFLICILYVY